MKKHIISSHAKCILAGEHAVLRGCPAVVFPLLSHKITLTYTETGLPVTAEAGAPYSETLLLFFWGILEAALKQVNKEHNAVSGQFFIQNGIPMGAGLGFSAAFCAAIAQWFLYKEWIEAEELIGFARQLENGFHGRSSGVDIAGALASQAIRFESIGHIKPLALTWQPKLYLSYSNHSSVTAKCIEIVDNLWRSDAAYAELIDANMRASVDMAERSLCGEAVQGPALLKVAIDRAEDCFARWGLISSELAKHSDRLKAAGAVAAKPTGAGEGGYVLSLWVNPPPPDLGFECLAVQ